MAPTYDRLHVRLLQIRERPAVIAEEQASFRARTRLEAEQMPVTDVLREPLSPALLDDVDAVLIGGAGAYSVVDTFDWTAGLIDLCHASADREMPLFGCCWGHQFVARAFGGSVVNDSARSEMGTCDVWQTEAGRTDALFGTLPARFGVQMGHHDRVERLPDAAVELATNDTAPFQAFRLGDLPIYGTQFHTELDAQTELSRLLAYRAHYPEMADERIFQATVDSLRPTPDADDLLRRFLLRFAVADGAALLSADLSASAPVDAPAS